MQKRRVVVTGMGVLTPIGNNVTEFWEALKEGKTKYTASSGMIELREKIACICNCMRGKRFRS